MIAAGIGAAILGFYSWKKKSAKGMKLAMWVAGGALAGATIENIVIVRILKK
jgi:hypothetical protein